LRRCVPITSLLLFNDTATTEIYTLSLHDALPISHGVAAGAVGRDPKGGSKAASKRLPGLFAHGDVGHHQCAAKGPLVISLRAETDRKSTRLNSSHVAISYAVFCLKKKKEA